MSESPKPLVHQDAERKDDDVLAREARTFLLATPTVQLVAELLTKLREANLPWWSPEVLRRTWPATERMRWLNERPDIRQRITTALTGLAPKAARKKIADFQAALVDSVVDDGDTTVRAFEEAFSPVELAVYGPVAAFWRAFRERFPWDDRRPAHRELVAWLIGALLNDKSFIDDMGRAPVLNAWDVRTAIDNRAWHTHMPVEVRAAIDDARLKREKVDPGEPFHAADDLSIALPETIATHVPLRDLGGVLDVAERAMGLGPPAPAESPAPPKAEGSEPRSSAEPPSAMPTSPIDLSAPRTKPLGTPPSGTPALRNASGSPPSLVGRKGEGGKGEAGKAEPPKAEAGKADAGKAEPQPLKAEAAKADAGKAVEASKAEAGKVAEAGKAGAGSASTTPPPQSGDDAPATARGETLRELAAAAVENLVGNQGLPTIFDDVEDLQSFVEIDPIDDIEQTGPKIVVPLGPTRR
ncbi:MAG TPA: hypothetical protein VFS43_14840 [Polyangiaceae bacterium]|nr:hypothetical protein [Polyangiaceae bacterium]